MRLRVRMPFTPQRSREGRQGKVIANGAGVPKVTSTACVFVAPPEAACSVYLPAAAASAVKVNDVAFAAYAVFTGASIGRLKAKAPLLASTAPQATSTVVPDTACRARTVAV